jgi:hypothetical protein
MRRSATMNQSSKSRVASLRAPLALFVITGALSMPWWFRKSPEQAPANGTGPAAAAQPPLPRTLEKSVPLPDQPIQRGERLLYAAYQTTPDESAPSAQHPDLEAALEIEDDDPARTQQVTDQARSLLKGDPLITSVDARCVQTFCRLRITKPLTSRWSWPDIDHALYAIAPGEAIFQTQNAGSESTAYLYFSAQDSHLPLSDLDPPEDDLL